MTTYSSIITICLKIIFKCLKKVYNEFEKSEGDIFMNIELKVDEKIKENKIIIQVNEVTDEVTKVFELIKQLNENKIKVSLEDEDFFVTNKDIESVYSEDKKVFVKTEEKIYRAKQRLYEFEAILPKSSFIRISNSEIINLDKVESINTKILGTIKITFYSGYVTYSSRRYIPQIKEALNI